MFLLQPKKEVLGRVKNKKLKFSFNLGVTLLQKKPKLDSIPSGV